MKIGSDINSVHILGPFSSPYFVSSNTGTLPGALVNAGVFHTEYLSHEPYVVVLYIVH